MRLALLSAMLQLAAGFLVLEHADIIDELDSLIDEELRAETALAIGRFRRAVKMRLCGNQISAAIAKACPCTKPVFLPRTTSDPLDIDLRRRKRSPQRSKRAGLAHECCYKMCTMELLRQHCAEC